jgi:hypothetical protein
MAVFARAFLYAKEEEIDYDVMAAKLATIDRHLLSCERSDVRPGPTFATDLLKAAQPIWAHLLVIGENRYRVSSSSVDADAAWEKIVANLFEQRQAA